MERSLQVQEQLASPCLHSRRTAEQDMIVKMLSPVLGFRFSLKGYHVVQFNWWNQSSYLWKKTWWRWRLSVNLDNDVENDDDGECFFMVCAHCAISYEIAQFHRELPNTSENSIILHNITELHTIYTHIIYDPSEIMKHLFAHRTRSSEWNYWNSGILVQMWSNQVSEPFCLTTRYFDHDCLFNRHLTHLFPNLCHLLSAVFQKRINFDEWMKSG